MGNGLSKVSDMVLILVEMVHTNSHRCAKQCKARSVLIA